MTEMNNSKFYIDLEKRYGARNYKPLDVVIKSADGIWVEDVEGNRYMDFLAAYSAVNQGHCNQHIMKAFLDQAAKVTLTSRAFRNDKLGLLYQKLSEMTGYQLSLPMNSGAEAVETAIKAARRYAYKVKGIAENEAVIITADGNFHGRTTTIVGFSTDEQYKKEFGPFTPGFINVVYGDIEALRNAITPNTAAFLVEPIQGEAGIVIPPDGYLAEVSKICKENDVLLICDEIQSGLARSGKLFAFEYDNIRPDMVIIGKALSGGFYPVSAVLGDEKTLGLFGPGDHGSTYGGNPLACAVAVAALEVIENERLIERSFELGNYFLEKLKGLNSKIIKEIRGRGLWIGIELNVHARPYCEELMKEGILCKETHDYVVRIAPPLIISKEEIDIAIEKFFKVFDGR